MARKKIWAVASAGGHWVQLLRLAPAWAGHEVVYVTTARGVSVPSGALVRVVTDANRWERLKMLRMGLEVLLALLKDRPDVVVTTGAAPGLAAVVFARLIGARSAWIDSIANSEELSGSGKVARRFATVCVTQWPQLADPGAGVGHWGAVL